MQILVTGGTGFIGEALLPSLIEAGHECIVLSRQKLEDTPGIRYINDLSGVTSGVDAVINLAGASLAGARWSAGYKREIVNSRLDTTSALMELIAAMEPRPRVLLSASAIGYYGHHGDEVLDEDGEAKEGFAQGLCQHWEAAATQAQGLGVRTCLLRLGVVLDAGGGAYEQMEMPFRLGVGNWIGNGKQWLSWIHRQDVVRAVNFLLTQDALEGAFNLTAPEAVTSRGFCHAMGKHRKTLFNLSMPAPVMRLMLGEMAEELLINGQRVAPSRLQDNGFCFSYPTLDEALTQIIAA
ncbi:MAG: TIGR01777 family oxidoreductase [Halioglobus sp.]